MSPSGALQLLLNKLGHEGGDISLPLLAEDLQQAESSEVDLHSEAWEHPTLSLPSRLDLDELPYLVHSPQYTESLRALIFLLSDLPLRPCGIAPRRGVEEWSEVSA